MDENRRRAMELVDVILERTESANGSGAASFEDYLADLVHDLAMELPVTEPMRRAAEVRRGNEEVILVFGGLAEGFRFVGPVPTNSPELEEFTDRDLRDRYWWYATPTTIEQARRELG